MEASIAVELGSEALISLGDFIYNAGWDASLEVSVSTAETPVIFGSALCGICEYYWTDENGYREIHEAHYSMGSRLYDGYMLCYSSDLRCNAHRTANNSGEAPSVSSFWNGSRNVAHLSGGNYYTFNVQTFGNPGTLSNSSPYLRIGADIVYYSPSSSPYPSWSSTNSYNFARSKKVTWSNKSTLSADVITPMNDGDTYNYNQLRQLVINWVDEQTTEPFDETDLPTWDELYPTEEPTTEDEGSGNTYYINNGRLYWNSGDGIQNIYEMNAEVTEPVETFDNYEDELQTLEFETLPQSTEDAQTLQVAEELVTSGLSLFPEGFLNIVLPVSIFCAVLAMMTKR